MAGITNRGKALLLKLFFQGIEDPAGLSFFVALGTNDTPPTADSNTLADVSQIATGNGYTDGGLAVARDNVDWDVLTEDDVNDRALIQAIDQVWTASGGSIPSGGNGARWAFLLTDEVTASTRQIIAYWDLAFDRTISTGQTLTLQNLELRLNGFLGMTNRGAYLLLQLYFQAVNPHGSFTGFYLALLDDAEAPNADWDTMTGRSEIPSGNGYTSGGIAVARDNVDFDVLTEDDGNDRALVQIKDITWTASGGNLPSAGNGARYAVLLTDEATVGSRQTIGTFDLGANWFASSGQDLVLQDSELRINES